MYCKDENIEMLARILLLYLIVTFPKQIQHRIEATYLLSCD